MASRLVLRQIRTVDFSKLNENFLWASMIWSAVAGGYLIYGWKQKSGLALAAGFALTAMSWIGPTALIMSLVCIGIIVAHVWLVKNF